MMSGGVFAISNCSPVVGGGEAFLTLTSAPVGGGWTASSNSACQLIRQPVSSMGEVSLTGYVGESFSVEADLGSWSKLRRPSWSRTTDGNSLSLLWKSA